MKKLALIVALAFSSASAVAQETVTYEYDALGRLVHSTTAGGPNHQVQTTIGYDQAGNRTNYTVANAPAGQGPSNPPQRRVIVVPLNGFTVIPLN